MKTKLSIGLIVASILLLIFVAVDAQQGHGAGSGDRDQQMDRDYDRDRDRDRDVVGDRDYDRDRDQDRDRDRSSGHDQDQDRDRVQDRDRLHVTDPASLRNKDIYGSALMTEEELKQYRNQLMNMETAEAREHYQARHEAKIQERAQLQGKDLVPPGQGPIYGGELMTVQERNEYREQLRQMQSEEEREAFQARHHERMSLRAKALELDIEEAE
jgi:Spy/CpxP family protein refolding chaperone